MSLISNIKDKIAGKVPTGTKRSPKWDGVRSAYLMAHPLCAVCCGKEKLQVHHKQPFHFNPTLELDLTNLITLCEAPGHNCHLVIGHAGNFKGYNPDVTSDAITWNQRYKRSDILATGGKAS